MPYQLASAHSVSADLQAILQDKLHKAAKQLSEATDGDRDDAIHETRKSVKRARAILRLLEPHLGDTFAADNAVLRKSSRKLSKLRDSAALLEIFDQLAKHAPGTELSPIRQALERDKQVLDEQPNAVKSLARIADRLSEESDRIESWPVLPSDGWKAIAPGLEATYQQGRRALRQAEKKQNPDAFHDLRKRAKDHFYHLELLQNLLGGAVETRAAQCKELEQWLGDDHNSVLLAARLRKKQKRYGDRDTVRAFLRLIKSSQSETRQRSLAAAKSLYAEKPSAFLEPLSAAWHKLRKPAASAGRASSRKKQPAA